MSSPINASVFVFTACFLVSALGSANTEEIQNKPVSLDDRKIIYSSQTDRLLASAKVIEAVQRSIDAYKRKYSMQFGEIKSFELKQKKTELLVVLFLTDQRDAIRAKSERDRIKEVLQPRFYVLLDLLTLHVKELAECSAECGGTGGFATPPWLKRYLD
jgi:hypothetical protein